MLVSASSIIPTLNLFIKGY